MAPHAGRGVLYCLAVENGRSGILAVSALRFSSALFSCADTFNSRQRLRINFLLVEYLRPVRLRCALYTVIALVNVQRILLL